MSNTTKKMTKRDYFYTLLTLNEVKNNSALVEFINHELELLAKKNAPKNTSEKKPTTTQLANIQLMEDILEFMEIGVKYTVSDLIKNCPACADLSTSKVSAMLRFLRFDGKIKRIEEKRKAYFQIVA